MAAKQQEDIDLSQILEKLRRHADFTHKDERELTQLAHELTDIDELFVRFRHLLGSVADKAIDAALKEYTVVYTHELESEMAHRRAKHDLARVFHLPVKLFLSRLKQPIPSIAGKLSQFFLEYGALHAGLVVGNMRIEWGQEGIVDAQPEVNIPDDDFVGSVDRHLGHLAQAAANINRQFSLADRESKTDEKIKLLIDSAERKEQVLGDLVRVIARYNWEKNYDLFKCNCQHFVRDALLALGINNPPRFSGKLKVYLDGLKQGKVEVPEDFKSHDGLDAYVRQQLRSEPGTLNQHDMEYLLLHYYRLHLDAMPRDADDNWRCRVPSCMYDALADRVNRESLLNNQFLPRPAAETFPPLTPTKSFSPSTPTIQERPSSPDNASGPPPDIEERPDDTPSGGASITDAGEAAVISPEEERRRDEELKRQQMLEDERTAREIDGDQERQKQLYDRHIPTGYHYRVMRKLRKIREYTEKSDKDLDKVVTRLTDFEELRHAYDCFPATIEETTRGHTLDAVADRQLMEAERLSREEVISKVQRRYEIVCKFPIKLVLRVKPGEQGLERGVYASRLEAALLVHDHLLHWDSQSSLAIPQRVNLKKLPPILTMSILCGSKWSTYISKQRSKVESIVKSPPDKLHRKEIELLYKLTAEKDGLTSAVIKTMIDYNRNKEYDETNCNNRHFIQDVTTAMGVKKLPEIRESLGVHLEQARLLCTDALTRTEFADHADLNDFVESMHQRGAISQLSITDVEYLVAKYFFYHVRHWELSHCPEEWECEPKSCQLKGLEQQLERLSLSSDKCVIL